MLTLTTQSQHRTHVLGNWPVRLIPLPKPSHHLYFWLTRSRLEFVPTTPFQVPLFVKMAHRSQESTFTFIYILLLIVILKLHWFIVVFQSLSCIQLFATHGLQHARLPCPSTISQSLLNSCPSRRWCHLSISSSVIPFSFCPQSFPAPGSFLMSQLFTSCIISNNIGLLEEK